MNLLLRGTGRADSCHAVAPADIAAAFSGARPECRVVLFKQIARVDMDFTSPSVRIASNAGDSKKVLRV